MKNNKSNLPRIFFVGQYPKAFDKSKSPYKSETSFSEWSDLSFFSKNGGNRGNLVWQESVFRLLSYDDLNSKVGSFKELNENQKKIDDEFDFIVINLACWISDKLFKPHNFISNLKFKKSKVICLGNGSVKNGYIKSNPNLSKSFFHPSVVQSLEWMADNAEIFSVRGQSTRQTLKKILNIDSIALGCPSAYVFPDSINNIRLKSFKDSFLASADYLCKYDVINLPIIYNEFNKFKSSSYFCQSSFQFFNGSNIEFPKGTKLNEIYNVKINEFDGSLKNYPFKIKNLNKIYAPNNVDNWRGVLSMHDYYIGARLHCAMLSLQAGVFPFIYYDDERPLEVANLIGMPHMNSSSNDSFELEEIFSKKNLKNFQQKYKESYNIFRKTISQTGLVL